MSDLLTWLEGQGLSKYAGVLADNEVDLEILPALSEQDLEKIGIPLGPRKKLLNAFAELRAGAAGERRAEAGSFTPAGGERRQLTVMFCDMVGFTELASRLDPEVLQRIIHSYEDLCAVAITRYAGYVFQRLGDGIVAFFGYPLAHEGEAERAIHAGLEIVKALSKLEVPEVGRIQVRIGIATGVVVVVSTEKGAVGETMNLAARLQGIAQPGSVVVSERVQQLGGGSFRYEDLGEHTLKGIARPSHAYRVLGVSEAASRFEAATQRGLTPLVGREEEIGLLLEHWELAQDGEGQVVLLSGEPGIGKSRILSALRERLEEQRRAGAALPVLALLREQRTLPHYRQLRACAAVRPRRAGGIEARQARGTDRRALREATEDVRLFASMLSIPCEDPHGPAALTPQRQKEETLRALVELTEAAARRVPSVVLYEDVHWADPTTSGDARPADRPGGALPAAHRVDAPPRVPQPLGGARACHVARLVQAHARTEQQPRTQPDRWQGPAGEPARAAAGQDRRGAAVRRGADQVGARIGRAQRGRRSLRVQRPRARHRHPRHLARLADGAPGPLPAGARGRPDRGRDRARVQLRADLRGVPALQARARRGPRPAHRVGAGLPAPGDPRCGVHLQARAGARHRLRFAAAEPAPGAAPQDRARDRAAPARDQGHRAGAAGPSLHRSGDAAGGGRILGQGRPARGGPLGLPGGARAPGERAAAAAEPAAQRGAQQAGAAAADRAGGRAAGHAGLRQPGDRPGLLARARAVHRAGRCPRGVPGAARGVPVPHAACGVSSAGTRWPPRASAGRRTRTRLPP